MHRRGFLTAILALAPAFAVAQENRHKKGGGASYIQLDAITATIPRADGSHGVMTVEVGVDAPDAALHARAAQSIPLLVAAYSQVVRTYAAGLGLYAAPNADYLAFQLQRQTDAVLGRPGARLLLGGVLVN